MEMFSRFKKRQFYCCECGSPLIKRTSLMAHMFLRHDTYVCDYPACGATYNGITEITHIASPSGLPDAPPCPLPESTTYLRNLAHKVYVANQNLRQMNLLEETETENHEILESTIMEDTNA